jgi:sporulation protein YlmC with PRC-barrel domain
MRNLLSTTALIAPFLIGTALAQTPPPAEPSDPPAEEQVEDTLPDTEAETDAETEGELDIDDQVDEDEIDTDEDAELDDPLETEPADAPEEDTLETEAETDLDTDPADQTEAEPLDATDPDAVDDVTDTTDDAPGTMTDEAPDDMTDDTAADPAADTAAPAAPGDGEAIVRDQAPNELRVDWITGSRVHSLDGENIGRISDLIFDEDTNTITVAIISVGGFLGIGAKDIAVKFEELQIDFDAREIQLDLTREAADEAPEYVFRDRAERPAAEPAMDEPAPAAPLD